ncbi:MAG: hypothetical protein U5K43_02595 [Halofilum sp. (in: g-proteobacteria)]|nr:hypothetical protein [Halofilum sp. (in: g-proteobacteria)]
MPPRAALAALLVGLTAAAGCSGAETFAQHPGFDAWFAAHPPDPAPASPVERELLRRYRPLLHVPATAAGPLDFYRDYIAHGRLHADGRTWSRVDRAAAGGARGRPGAVFVHEPPPGADARAVAYGRVEHARLAPFGRLTFLEWHFVFRVSGLPAALPAWQEWLAGLAGDPHDWHQLDHYTAATLVLGPAPGHVPLGLVLQQHNAQRAYWFGRDLPRPPNGRVRLAAALRSNELYPWRGQQARHRAVRFLEPGNAAWLTTGHGERPWDGSHDVTVPGRRVDYALRFLAGTDPFYRFSGRLGADRWLPGRDGPPGADYDAIPAFQARPLQLCAFRWPRRHDDDRLAALEALLAAPGDAGARATLMEDCRRFVAKSIGYNSAATSHRTARR